MKISLKNITLKDDTLEDINRGEIDTDKFVQYIRTNLENANYIIDTKLLSLEDIELYDALSKLFIIELDENDILGILKRKNNKHYFGTVSLKTTMVDEEGNNIELIGAASNKVSRYDKLHTLQEIRRLVNSYDFVVLQTIRTRYDKKISNPEMFEDYQIDDISLGFDDDELFNHKIALLSKEIRNKSTLKKVITSVEQYIKELVYQAKYITRIDEDEESKKISLLYKNAYESNFNKKSISKSGKHKKSY